MNSRVKRTRAEEVAGGERGGTAGGVKLEMSVVGHVLLSFQSLSEAQENISREAVRSPITTSLKEKGVCTETVEVCSPSPPKTVSAVATCFEAGCIKEFS